MENGPRWRCVLRPADGDGGDDVLLLSVWNPPCPARTRRHRREDEAYRTMTTRTLISARNLRSPMYARSTPALLSRWSPPKRSFPHPFFAAPSSICLPAHFRPPRARSIALKRASLSLSTTLIRGRETVHLRGLRSMRWCASGGPRDTKLPLELAPRPPRRWHHRLLTLFPKPKWLLWISFKSPSNGFLLLPVKGFVFSIPFSSSFLQISWIFLSAFPSLLKLDPFYKHPQKINKFIKNNKKYFRGKIWQLDYNYN